MGEIAAAANDADFDLTGDGSVDSNDLSAWLFEAGETNLGSGRSYLLGDANLDGTVDGPDFLIWNDNKFTTGRSWCGGDFDADGVTNGADFLIWNSNKFQTALLNIPRSAEPTSVTFRETVQPTDDANAPVAQRPLPRTVLTRFSNESPRAATPRKWNEWNFKTNSAICPTTTR